YPVKKVAQDEDFIKSTKDLHQKYSITYHALGEIKNLRFSLQYLLQERFGPFAEPTDVGNLALKLCDHHENVQKNKSIEGKRPWFDRLGQDLIYIRHAYRIQRKKIMPDQYLHTYRGWPIRRFYQDLT
ncbi:hypothetical protein ACFL4L_02735, partial [bacterium]